MRERVMVGGWGADFPGASGGSPPKYHLVGSLRPVVGEQNILIFYLSKTLLFFS